MVIELFDLDVTYAIQKDVTDSGKDIVKIIPRTDLDARDEDYDIVLDYEGCQELIRTLQFISKEIRPKKKR